MTATPETDRIAAENATAIFDHARSQEIELEGYRLIIKKMTATVMDLSDEEIMEICETRPPEQLAAVIRFNVDRIAWLQERLKIYEK